MHPALESAYPVLLHIMNTLPHLLSAAAASGTTSGDSSAAAAPAAPATAAAAVEPSPYAACSSGPAAASIGASLALKTARDPAQVRTAVVPFDFAPQTPCTQRAPANTHPQPTNRTALNQPVLLLTHQLSRIKRDLAYHTRSDELVDRRQLAVNQVRCCG